MCIESFCIGAPFLILLLPSLQRPHFQHRLRRDNASRVDFAEVEKNVADLETLLGVVITMDDNVGRGFIK